MSFGDTDAVAPGFLPPAIAATADAESDEPGTRQAGTPPPGSPSDYDDRKLADRRGELPGEAAGGAPPDAGVAAGKEGEQGDPGDAADVGGSGDDRGEEAGSGGGVAAGGGKDERAGARDEPVRVFVRCRPATKAERSKEGADALRANAPAANVVSLDVRGGKVRCEYDHVFGPAATQEQVFDELKGSIAAVTEGINCTVFAYGQTGTGKTHTMLGKGVEKELAASSGDTRTLSETTKPRWGVIPRAVALLLSSLRDATREATRGRDERQVTVHCSYLQIYNEKVFDLLLDSREGRPLPLREHDGPNGKEVYVSGLSEYRVSTVDDVMALLAQGSRKRAVRATEYNEASSRSHAILQLSVTVETRRAGADRKVIRRAKLSLVDLAGSEKWDTNLRLDAGRTKELTAINKSLSALGNCIAALTEKRRVHIPYRDSALTRLLQDSLGGNTRTIVVATVCPAASAAEESASTLAFADRARQIMVKVSPNEVVDDAVLLARARREISRLRKILHSQSVCTCGGVRAASSAPSTDTPGTLHRVGSRRHDAMGRLSRPTTRGRASRLKEDVRAAARLQGALDDTSARGGSGMPPTSGSSPNKGSHGDGVATATSRRRRRGPPMGSPVRVGRKSDASTRDAGADDKAGGIAMRSPIRPRRASADSTGSQSLSSMVETAMEELVNAVAAVVERDGAPPPSSAVSSDGKSDTAGSSREVALTELVIPDDADDGAPTDEREARRRRYLATTRPTTSPSAARHKAKVVDATMRAAASPMPVVTAQATLDEETRRRIASMQEQLRVLTTQSLDLVRLLEEEEAKNEELEEDRRALAASEEAAVEKRNKMAAQLATMARQNKELCALLEEEESRARDMETRMKALTDQGWQRSAGLEERVKELEGTMSRDNLKIKQLQSELAARPTIAAPSATPSSMPGAALTPAPTGVSSVSSLSGYSPGLPSASTSYAARVGIVPSYSASSYASKYGTGGAAAAPVSAAGLGGSAYATHVGRYGSGGYSSLSVAPGALGDAATHGAPLTSGARLDYSSYTLRGGAAASAGPLSAYTYAGSSQYLSGARTGAQLHHYEPGKVSVPPGGLVPLGGSQGAASAQPSSLVSVPGFAPSSQSHYAVGSVGAASVSYGATGGAGQAYTSLGGSSSLPSLSKYAYDAGGAARYAGAHSAQTASVAAATMTASASTPALAFAAGPTGAAASPPGRPAAYDYRAANVDQLTSSYANITFGASAPVAASGTSDARGGAHGSAAAGAAGAVGATAGVGAHAARGSSEAAAPSAHAHGAGARAGAHVDASESKHAPSPARNGDSSASVERPHWMRGSSIIYEDARMAAAAEEAPTDAGVASFQVPPPAHSASGGPPVRRAVPSSPAVAGMDRPLDSRSSVAELGLGITTPRRGQESPSLQPSPMRTELSGRRASGSNASGVRDGRAISPGIFGLTSNDSDEDDISGNPASRGRRRGADIDGPDAASLALGEGAVPAAQQPDAVGRAGDGAAQRAHRGRAARRGADDGGAAGAQSPPPPPRQQQSSSPKRRQAKEGRSPSHKHGAASPKKRRSAASKSTAAAGDVYHAAVPAPSRSAVRPGHNPTSRDLARDALAAASRALA